MPVPINYMGMQKGRLKQHLGTSGLLRVITKNEKENMIDNPRTIWLEDGGQIPNSKYPLLLYMNAFSEKGEKGAEWLEERFASNGWTNSWRWGIHPYHHYHSNTHEVLGVFSGSAELQMGGEQGVKVRVKAGDVIVIPAGVGHKCLSHEDDFTVVGAYPDGAKPDMNKGEEGERPQVDENIKKVPLPSTDPLHGEAGGLCEYWK
jgi:uncharacterized protein YjlB